MEFLKLESKDNENGILKKISEFMQQREEEFYHEHAPDTIEHQKLIVTASPRPDRQIDYYLLRDEQDVGYLILRENLITDKHHMGVTIWIQPQFRKQGYFIETLQFVIDIIPPHIELLTPGLILRVQDGEVRQTPFQNWLESTFEVKIAYHERINVADLDLHDKDVVHEIALQLQTEAKAKGFSLHHVENGDFKQSNDFDYEEFLSMIARIWNDMPSEDADWEDEVISDEIYQAYFNNIRELNGFVWTIIAVHDETKKAVGMTDIYFYRDNKLLIRQGDTGVDAPFRGKGLGRTLKYTMLHKLLTNEGVKDAKWWATGNANSNIHMLRINDELGYCHEYSNVWYEIPVSKVGEFLSNHNQTR